MNERVRIRREETGSAPVIVGVSSLLVVFSVLCLTVFAMLSLMTVQVNKRLLKNSVDTVTERAEADARAQEILADLRAGNVPEGVTQGMTEGVTEGMTAGNGQVYSYTCPVSETAHLEVSVSVDGDDYRILKWTEVSDVDWESDESIDVWQEDFFGGLAAPLFD